ncbi:MAG: hypothetical protein ACRC9N_11280 [Aeromonas sp.]
MENKKRAGRPRFKDGEKVKQFTAYLNDDQIVFAKELGMGSVSAGLRFALQRWIDVIEEYEAKKILNK